MLDGSGGVFDVDFEFGAIAGQIEFGEGIQDGREPIVAKHFDKVLESAQLVLFDLVRLFMPRLTFQDHSDVDQEIGEEHKKQKKTNWVDKNFAELKEAYEPQEERHPWHEYHKEPWQSEIIVDVDVVVNVHDQADERAQPDMEYEGEIVALVLVSRTFAQKHAVVVALEDALVARETVMRARRCVELSSRTVAPFGKQNPRQINRMNGAVGGHGFEKVAYTVEERVDAHEQLDQAIERWVLFLTVEGHKTVGCD